MYERVRACASAHGIGIPELPVRLGYSTLPLNSESMPMRDVNLSWAGRGKALVNTSARLSSDAQCSTSFRPVPTARHSLMLGRSFGTGHSLPGASPLGPLVHMLNPSSSTHVSFQSLKLHLSVLLPFTSI